jgi:hypothetical protein
MLLKLFHKIKTEAIIPDSFQEASVTLIPKPDKNATKKEIYFFDVHRCKNPQYNNFKQN